MTTEPSPFHYCFWLQSYGHECGRVGGILRTPEPYLPPWVAALLLLGIFLGFTTLFWGSYIALGKGWIVIALHCDQDGCDSWARTGGISGGEFFVLTSAGPPAPELFVRHFCTLDCVGRWAIAHSEPTEQLVEL